MTQPSMRCHSHDIHKTQVLLFNLNSQTRPNGLLTSSLRIILRCHIQMNLHHCVTSSVLMSKTISPMMMTSIQTNCIHPILSPSQKKILIGMNGIGSCQMNISSNTPPTQKQRSSHYADQCHEAAILFSTHHYHQRAAYKNSHGIFRVALRSAGNRKQSSTLTLIFQSRQDHNS